MFDDEKIRLIEQMPDSDTILVIWVKLLAQAGKTNSSGYIFLSENIPYTDEMLATIFNRPLSTIRLALKTFEELGMIGIDDNSFISITNWEKHQNVEGLERIRRQTRERVRRHRKRKAGLLDDPNQCVYCNEKENLSIDHIIPTSKGGIDSNKNTVYACLSCNRQKNNHGLVKFLNDKLVMGEYVDVEGIRNNKKLKRHLTYSSKENRFKECNVTCNGSNAPEEELEGDKEGDIKYIVEIVAYLNDMANRNYRHTTRKTQSLIRARMNEGFTVDDFKQVIDIKTNEWLNNDEMNKYLRPETLFGTKFESYLNQEAQSTGYDPSKDAF